MYIYIHLIKKFPDVFRRNYTFWTCIFNWTCPSLRRSIIAWPIHYAFEHQRAEQRDIFWISNCKLSHNFSGTNGSLIRKKNAANKILFSPEARADLHLFSPPTEPVMAPHIATGKHSESGTARFLGSASSGVLELLLFHPVDTVAKRLMSNQSRVCASALVKDIISGYW